MSQEKQKKPFLKRGSRQFLSNAQVRSQSSKPKIHEFEEDQDERPIQVPATKAKTYQKIQQNHEEDFVVAVKKPSSTKVVAPPRQPNIQRKSEQIQVSKNQGQVSASKKREVSIGKKKQAALADYLDNQSGLNEYIPVKKNVYRNQPTPEVNKKKIQQKVQPEPVKKHVGSMKSHQLVQQDDDDDLNYIQNDSFKPIVNNCKNKEAPKVVKEEKKIAKKQANSDQQFQQIQFISDNQQEEVHHKNSKKPVEQEPQFSKIKNQYFNRNNQKKQQKTVIVQQKVTVPIKKALTTADVPQQIKDQIIKQTLQEKQQTIIQQLLKVQQKLVTVNKQKQRLEQQHKSLSKARQQFQKQMQQKVKQFEQRMKNQNSKLTRQKKYMKDAQMSNKGDWKSKMQLQQANKTIELLKQDKKKNQAKYKKQIQILRKSLTDETNKNKALAESIKLLQYGNTMLKEQMSKMKNQARKQNNHIHRIGMWADAPESSYVDRCADQQFSLIEMNVQDFHYEANQYYQYYLKKQNQNENSILQSETSDSDRAKRVYKNGKVEQEYFGKFLKQIFPFNYSIVLMSNGDIKQILPSGIIIYYSRSSNATQYIIKKNDTIKDITYFPGNQSVQMQFTHQKNSDNNVLEIYCNGHLKRTLQDGTVILKKKDNRGNIISIPVGG